MPAKNHYFVRARRLHCGPGGVPAHLRGSGYHAACEPRSGECIVKGPSRRAGGHSADDLRRVLRAWPDLEIVHGPDSFRACCEVADA